MQRQRAFGCKESISAVPAITPSVPRTRADSYGPCDNRSVRVYFRCLLVSALLLLSACQRGTVELPPAPRFDISPNTPGARAQITAANAEFQANPNSANANMKLAKVLLAYQMYAAGSGYLRRAAALQPDNLPALYLLGWASGVVGNHEAAVADFDRALEVKKDHPQSRLRRADALRRLNRLDEAEKAYRSVLKSFPDQPQAQFGLGNVLFQSGRFQEAIDVLRPAVEAFTRYGAAQYTLSLAFRQVGDVAAANTHLAAYQRSRTWEPPFEDPEVESVKELDRSQVGLHALSVKAAAAGDWAKAAELLEESVSIDPNYLVGHLNLITCYAHLGNAAKVEENYQRALALSPDSAELQNTRGLYAKVNGRLAEARTHFLKAIQTDPNHYTSYENLGSMSFDEGDMDAALRYYEKAVAIAPWSSRSWLRAGLIHLKQGRRREAGEAFLRTVRPGPEAESVLGEIRTAYQQAKDAAAWSEFARAALNQAKRSGLVSLVPSLESPL